MGTWSANSWANLGSWRGYLGWDRTPSDLFTPVDISGCILWLRSDLGVTKVANIVSAWADQSGQGNNFTQGTDANKPTYTAGAINGYPALVFDGNDYLDSSMAANQPATVYIVSQLDDGSGTGEYLCDGDDATDRWVIGYDLATGNQLVLFAGTVLADATYPADANYHIFEGIFNGASSSIKYDDATAVVGAGGAANISGWRLGADRVLGAGFFLDDGGIAEVIVYNSVLSTGNKALIQSYLNTRYNIY
jgi:hypothetical protein